MSSLYLASKSPRRRELLVQIGVPHTVVDADVLEVPFPHEMPQEYVQRLAQAKAQAGFAKVLQQQSPLLPVLGADTIVVANGQILEKPANEIHAATMLSQLSGTTHQVMTAVAMVNELQVQVKLSITNVSFRELSANEISAYWHTGEPQDKAGGYAIQGLGAVFVKQLEGSYSGVVGLPIEQTLVLLQEFGVPWWQAKDAKQGGLSL